MSQKSLARATPKVDDVDFGRKIVPSLRPWRPLRELAGGEEVGATAGSHAKDAKGAKERDNRCFDLAPVEPATPGLLTNFGESESSMACRRRRRGVWKKDSRLLCGLGVLCVSLLAVRRQMQPQDLTQRTQRAQRKEITAPGSWARQALPEEHHTSTTSAFFGKKIFTTSFPLPLLITHIGKLLPSEIHQIANAFDRLVRSRVL
jgi:hypothetical protein